MNAFMSPRFSADPMATSAPIIKPSSTMPAPAPKQNAFAAKAAAPMPAASPAQNPFAISQPASPGPLANAFKGFATGLLGVDKINAMDDRYKAQDAEDGKKKLAMLQQFRAMPVEQRMAALPQLSQAIGKEIPPDTMSDQAIDAQVAMMSGQLGIAPATPEGPLEINGQLVDPKTREVLGDYRTAEKPNDGSNIRQVGNQIVERQQDGSWKPVYTGASAEDAARAFATFIDLDTGEQMALMSDGKAQGTGRKAYIPQQITSVAGVPTAVDKRTLDTTQLSPLASVAGNKAAIASAEVQGKAQGQAAFDLPAVEQRAQTAIGSIDDLKGRNIDTRFGLQGKVYALPGSEGADVQALLTQITSQAFLNAFDQLRGAGAITETEGKAATAAITRLQDRNISVGEALKSMNELQQYYRKGLEVAKARAVKAPVLPNMPAGATQKNQNQPARISGDDEFDALPSGARFMGPDGVVRVKP